MARLLVRNIVHAGARLRPDAITARRADHDFDRRHGTDTSGLVNLSSLRVDPGRARHGVRYQPSSAASLTDPVAKLAIDPADYVFIDYGCGKGRVVLLAALQGFKRVVGVEFAPELCAIARRNIDIVARDSRLANEPEIIEGDAGAFDPPRAPLLCYFYNPFDDVVMADVVACLVAALDAGAADIKIIYADPRHADAFTRGGRFEIIADDGETMLLQSLAAPMQGR